MSAPTQPRARLSAGMKRGIWIGAAVLFVLFLVLGTRVVSNDDPAAQGAQEFDAATFGAENFPEVQEQVAERAEPAAELAGAIASDREAAVADLSAESSGGPVFSVTLTGTVGEGQSGMYNVVVPELADGPVIRVQTGPAINGTELRDATGEIDFGEFTNQIDFQNAASALNEELKTQVLEQLDFASLAGETVTITGAFTLINDDAWLVTPTEIEVGS